VATARADGVASLARPASWIVVLSGDWKPVSLEGRVHSFRKVWPWEPALGAAVGAGEGAAGQSAVGVADDNAVSLGRRWSRSLRCE